VNVVGQIVLHLLGIDDANSPWYLLYSGIAGSASTLAALVTFTVAFLRKHNCHVQGCWRIGRHPVEGTAFVTCARHHPRERAPTEEEVDEAARRVQGVS
jgi:hypothetical protein